MKKLLYYPLFFLAGAILLSGLSIIQKIISGVSLLEVKGYIIPGLYGGIILTVVGFILKRSKTKFEQEFRALLDFLPYGIMWVGKDKRIIDLNKKAIEMTKYNRDDVVGMICHQNLCPAQVGECPIIDLNQKVENRERLLLTGDNKRIPVVKTVKPVTFMGKECLFEAFIDISEIKEKEKEIDEIKRQMYHSTKLASIGKLVSGIVHEINNPLTVINGNIDRIKMECKDINDKRLSSIERATERIQNIVLGLRIYSRSNKDIDTIFDVNDVTQKSISLIQEIYGKIGVNFVEEYSKDQIFLKGDLGKYQQILMNLISNAKDALVESSEKLITISTNAKDDFIEIHIKDTGKGISNEMQERIFESFFTTKEAGAGTGLGLSITQELISELNGQISLDSELGKGTTFTLRLPRSSQEEADNFNHEQKIDHFENIGIGVSVLVVEDEPDVREILKDYLEDLGFSVEEAEDGKVAIDQLKKQKFQVIISDLVMPNIDGYELIETIKKEQLSKALIMVITGKLESAFDINEFKKHYPVEDVLSKPFTKRDLYVSLKEICERL